MTRIPVAIVDDEPLARHKLRLFFEPLADFEICGEAGDGAAALRLIADQRPRLVCLDVRLPGMSGLDVLRRARPDPAVIFTTAFDRYAVTAFELAAVDYLLKPFGRERFMAAIERARAWLARPGPTTPVERFRDVHHPERLTRLFVRDAGVVRPLPVSSVQHCESNDDTVLVHAEGRRYRLHVTLTDLAARLDPTAFIRIHRRLLVNLDFVTAITPAGGSRFALTLQDGTVLPVSRQRSRQLRGRGL
jgi:two-component system LytT family response regulator